MEGCFSIEYLQESLDLSYLRKLLTKFSLGCQDSLLFDMVKNLICLITQIVDKGGRRDHTSESGDFGGS
jgi:hypothetical protein